MTTSQSRNLRKAGAVALSLALAMSTLAITPASAAKKVKLAKTKITVNVGKTKTVKIKNVKKKQVKKLTVKSSKAAVAKAKASKKTAIKVTGKKAGSAKVTANLKLKKKVGGKKAYKLTLKVTVKKAAPTPTAAPTVAPTAAPTPVVTGTSITLDKGVYSVATGVSVTITAKLLPETSNEDVTWSVDDTKIATVSGSGATVSGVATAVLTGVEVGSTHLYATIGAKRAMATVEVTKNHITAKIESAKMGTSDSIEITFDNFKADTEGFGYDKISVVRETNAGTRNDKVIKKLSEGADGKVYTVQVQDPFANGDKVTVKYANTSASFTVVIKDPKQATITTLQAEKDKPTAIAFQLWDENGTDVTAANKANFESRVEFSISDDKAGTNTDDLNNAGGYKITMTTLNGTATVKLIYKDAEGKELFNATQLITCVPTQATKGKFRFKGTADGTKTVGDLHVAKFYTGKDLTAVEVPAEEDVTVYAFAEDEAGAAISYDPYGAEVADDTIASAETIVDDGKFAEFKISGLKPGTTTVNITAEKYGVKAYYAIPVKVTDKKKFKSVSITSNRKSIGMSNAPQDGYDAEITVKVVDTYDRELDVSDYVTNVEISKMPKNAEGLYTFDKGTGIFKAYTSTGSAPAGTYTFTASYNDGTWDKDKTVSTQITVTDAAKFADCGPTVAVDYKVELVDEHGVPVKEIKNTADMEAKGYTAHIAAYKSTTFLGYVGDTEIGNWSTNGFTTGIEATAATRIDAMTTAAAYEVKKGAKKAYFVTSTSTTPGVARLYNFGKVGTDTTEVQQSAEDDNTITFANLSGGIEYGKDDSDFAEATTYTINAKTKVGNKDKTLSTTFKITDVLAASKPTITPNTYKVESLDEEGVINVLSTNVDMNNNEGLANSVTSVVQNKDATDKAWNIKGFWVSEDVKGEGIISYYVGVGSWTFNLAS